MKRSCKNILDGGVDLNRNYGYKFAYDDKGSSNLPCETDYRGEKAFSESETQAVKHLVEMLPDLTSAMNFHACGNLLVTPFNY